jgi:hypothetical protein
MNRLVRVSDTNPRRQILTPLDTAFCVQVTEYCLSLWTWSTNIVSFLLVKFILIFTVQLHPFHFATWLPNRKFSLVFVPCIVWLSIIDQHYALIYHSFIWYAGSYMFRHPCDIFRELLMSLWVTWRQKWLCCLSCTVNVVGLCALVVVVSCLMLSSWGFLVHLPVNSIPNICHSRVKAGLSVSYTIFQSHLWYYLYSTLSIKLQRPSWLCHSSHAVL